MSAMSYHRSDFLDGMWNMKSLIGLAGIATCVGLLVSCGGEDEHPKDPGAGAKTGVGGIPGKAGSSQGGKGNQPGEGGAGGSGDGIEVSITSPTAASDPNGDEVLIGSDVVVKCVARAGADASAVKASSVKIAVVTADGTVVDGTDGEPLELSATPSGQPDEYQAELSLATSSSGSVSFRCTASSDDDSVTGSATLTTLLDHGPTIAEKLPEENSAHKLFGALEVEFTVTPTLLTDDDEEAGIESVKLFVAGVAIEKGLKADANHPGTYRASVDFQDEFLFDEPPTEHTSVRIEATNLRTSTAVTAIRDYPFVVDGKDPVVTIEAPADNAPVKGETVIQFTAVDTGAGIDEDTLEISLNSQDPIKYDATDTSRWDRDGNTFIFRFDTAEVGEVSAQITVDILVADNAGNAVDGASIFLWLDDVGPIVDLDPGNWRIETNGACSASFDPLGSALNDGASFGAFANVRALVYDVTKESGQKVSFPALADPMSVKLYAQIDPTKPFLVDTGVKDGVCDDFAQKDFPFKTLLPVKVAGVALNSEDADTEPLPPDACALEKPEAQAPDTLCGGFSDMHKVVQHDVRSQEPETVVYAMGVQDGAKCTGTEWDPRLIEPLVQGWICYGAVASDKKGNTAVSRPLRVCYDNPNVPGVPDCSAPPTCTDGCSAPEMGSHLYETG
jgi:hypothetical protein